MALSQTDLSSMDFSQLFLIALFILVGLFSITSSVLNSEWFFSSRKMATYVRLFGRTGARVFCVLLGIGLIVAGTYFYLHGF
jgi:putative flippase GtrA